MPKVTHDENLFAVAFSPKIDKLCACDFGKFGGFVWNDGERICSRRMPLLVNESTDLAAVHDFLATTKPAILYAENVQAQPKQSSIATATFFRHIGQIEGLAASVECPMVLVRPQEWMQYFEVGKRSDYPTKSKWKQHLYDIGMELHPQAIITLNTSDALLLWRFAQEQHDIRIRKLTPFKKAKRK